MTDGVSIKAGLFGGGQWVYDQFPVQLPPRVPPNEDELAEHVHHFPQVCPAVAVMLPLFAYVHLDSIPFALCPPPDIMMDAPGAFRLQWRVSG